MKSWQAKLKETMKDDRVKACPKIQIGGIPKSMSVEHLVTVKTWMAMKNKRKKMEYSKSLIWQSSSTKKAY